MGKQFPLSKNCIPIRGRLVSEISEEEWLAATQADAEQGRPGGDNRERDELEHGEG